MDKKNSKKSLDDKLENLYDIWFNLENYYRKCLLYEDQARRERREAYDKATMAYIAWQIQISKNGFNQKGTK